MVRAVCRIHYGNHLPWCKISHISIQDGAPQVGVDTVPLLHNGGVHVLDAFKAGYILPVRKVC